MIASRELEPPVASPNIAARRRLAAAEGEPLLLADWDRALFLHYEIDPEVLQPHVPFKLDLFEGRAFVSLVAFTMRHMCFERGGQLMERLFAPVAEQRFLNLRTYVHDRHDVGIFFIAEWMSHWLCVQLGPLLYGLPYHWGRLEYCHTPEHGHLNGRVEARDGRGVLSYSASVPGGGWRFAEANAGSLDDFLLERYTAFTRRGSIRRFFHVLHRPWLQTQAEVEIADESLLSRSMPWWNYVRLVGANYSPGVSKIGMGPPRRLD